MDRLIIKKWKSNVHGSDCVIRVKIKTSQYTVEREPEMPFEKEGEIRVIIFYCIPGGRSNRRKRVTFRRQIGETFVHVRLIVKGVGVDNLDELEREVLEHDPGHN